MEPATECLWREALLAMREAPNVHAAAREEMEKWLSLLVEIVEAGRSSGAFPPGSPAGEVVRRLVALCVGIDVMVGFDLPGHSKDHVRKRIDACIDALLGSASR